MTKHSCKQCKSAFEITDTDLEFYKKISPVFNGEKYLIPPPTACPDCRRQRRAAFRNDFHFYKRKCDLTGKDVVSLYNPNTKFPVYNGKDWWSDKWDSSTYAQDFDFSKTFSEQFSELQKKVPRIAIMNDNGVSSNNCEYCHDFACGKNCYFAIGGWEMEDVLFAYYNVCYLTDIMDVSYNILHCQESYELTRCQKIYGSKYLLQCLDSSDCFFGYDLHGCQDCFCCSHLRQKSYCVYNKQYSKEEYFAFMKTINFGSYSEMQKYHKQFLKLVQSIIHPAAYLINSENCVGDRLINCQEVYGFDVVKGQCSKFVENGESINFCYDVMNTGEPQYCLEGVTPDKSWMTHFSVYCRECKEVMYSDNCHNSNYLFGCIGVHHKKYCIFNKQYSKEEYNTLVPNIIEHMRQNGEWGEFFSPTLSPFGYNESIANEYYQLTKEQAQKEGFNWLDYKAPKPDVKKIISKEQMTKLPDDIKDIPDEILNWALTCNVSGNLYRIVKQELEFYRGHNIPIPRKSPEQRHKDRMVLRNPRKLWKRNCMKCKKDIQTTYAPERPEIVYCEKCYLDEVY